MKRVFLLLSVAALAFSCTEAEEVTPNTEVEDGTATLTFEDADYTASANYTGASSWSSLIDLSEFGGTLLYNYDADYNVNSEYAWSDAGNTELASAINYSDWGTAFWNGGVAVSSYYLAVSEESQADYDRQLSIPYIDANGKSGYNGSDNFAIVFDWGSIYFGDGTARVIESMMISPTSYWMSVALYGDGDVDGLGSSDWFKITATAYDAEYNTLGTSDYYLAENGVILEGWNKWDLSALGEVNTVTFTAEGSVLNDWGSALPGYFAVDNIVVKL